MHHVCKCGRWYYTITQNVLSGEMGLKRSCFRIVHSLNFSQRISLHSSRCQNLDTTTQHINFRQCWNLIETRIQFNPVLACASFECSAVQCNLGGSTNVLPAHTSTLTHRRTPVHEHSIILLITLPQIMVVFVRTSWVPLSPLRTSWSTLIRLAPPWWSWGIVMAPTTTRWDWGTAWRRPVWISGAIVVSGGRVVVSYRRPI